MLSHTHWLYDSSSLHLDRRLKVSPHDYKLVATLDPRAMWVKVSVLMRQYMQTLSEKFPLNHGLAAAEFRGRPLSVAAPQLKLGHIKALCEVPHVQLRMETAVIDILRHYTVTNPGVDKVMAARARVFASFGKVALKAGAAIEQAASKTKAMHKEFTAEQRAAVADEALKDQFWEIESKYSASLVAAGTTWNEQPLPLTASAVLCLGSHEGLPHTPYFHLVESNLV